MSNQKQAITVKKVQPIQEGQGEKVVKYRRRPRNGCDGRSVAKVLKMTIQVKICVASSQLHYMGIGRKFTWIVIAKILLQPTFTAISWPPPVFYNFFTLAFLLGAFL